MLEPTYENILKVSIKLARGMDKLHIMRALDNLRCGVHRKAPRQEVYTVKGINYDWLHTMGGLCNYMSFATGTGDFVLIMGKRYYNKDLQNQVRSPYLVKFGVYVRDERNQRLAVSYSKLKKEILTPCCQTVPILDLCVPTSGYTPIWVTAHKDATGKAIYSRGWVTRFLEKPDKAVALNSSDVLLECYY